MIIWLDLTLLLLSVLVVAVAAAWSSAVPDPTDRERTAGRSPHPRRDAVARTDPLDVS